MAQTINQDADAHELLTSERRYSELGGRGCGAIRFDSIRFAGWSGAANMEYPVKDRKVLEMLTVGDHIRGTVFAQDSAYWLGEIEILSEAKGARPDADVSGDRPARQEKGK